MPGARRPCGIAGGRLIAIAVEGGRHRAGPIEINLQDRDGSPEAVPPGFRVISVRGLGEPRGVADAGPRPSAAFGSAPTPRPTDVGYLNRRGDPDPRLDRPRSA
jgi:hypothetical protein